MGISYREFAIASGVNQDTIMRYVRLLEPIVERMEKNDSNRVGMIFYPIMVETANALNEKYSDVLTQLTQKVTDVKQVYLDTKVKAGAFIFKTKKFSSANFKFQQKGMVWNPFSSMMGIKMVK